MYEELYFKVFPNPLHKPINSIDCWVVIAVAHLYRIQCFVLLLVVRVNKQELMEQQWQWP